MSSFLPNDSDRPPLPLISVIVATYNAHNTLAHCLESVLNQSYPSKELIVIDGKSTDRTTDILRSTSSASLRWISEKDSGIYQAWNKALKLAQGEWICFIGADDYWSGSDSLEKLVRCGLESGSDVVCLKGVRIDEHGKEIGTVGAAWDWTRMKRWQCVLHSGMLQKKLLFDRFGKFNESYRIAGDYEFLLRLGEDLKAAFIDEPLICVGDNGLSRTHVTAALKETQKIQHLHKEIGSCRASRNYWIAQAKALVRGKLCSLC